MMLDVPVAPFYLVATFLIHPHLGVDRHRAPAWRCSSSRSSTRSSPRYPSHRPTPIAMRANLAADAMARNSQVINAMGMIPEGVQIWGRETAESLKAHVIAQDRNTY